MVGDGYNFLMSPSEKLSILRQQISVMRDKIAEQNTSLEKMISRMFALLGIEITLSGLLASPIIAIPYPVTISGKIFFYMGISSIVISFTTLLFNYRTTKNWPSPMGKTEVQLMELASNEYESLRILYQDYRLCYDQMGQAIDPRAKNLNASLMIFVMGVILLIVLKFGG